MATGLMDTFTSGIKTAIEGNSSITAPVRIRRSIEVDEKKDTAKTFVTIAPSREWLERGESVSSYLVRVSAKIRCNAVYATDASAVSNLATLVMEVRKALYGENFGGRMFVETDIEGEYQTDDVTQNLYYYEMELIGEYQESI